MFDSVSNNYGCLCCISGGGCNMIEHAIGTIKAIYAHNYCRFDRMFGTSGGALVASLLMSLDQNISDLENIIRSTDPSKWFSYNRINSFLFSIGLKKYICSNEHLKNFILENVSTKNNRVDVTVTDTNGLGINNVVSHECYPRTVLASMSYNGIFPPVYWGGLAYSDGGRYEGCPSLNKDVIAHSDNLFVILQARRRLSPEFKTLPFTRTRLSRFEHIIDCSDVRMTDFESRSNVVTFQPTEFVKSASFTKWSNDFDQIRASYDYALDILESRDIHSS